MITNGLQFEEVSATDPITITEMKVFIHADSSVEYRFYTQDFCITFAHFVRYQVYKYVTGDFFEKIHVYLIKMVIHSIFKVMAIASHTFFPSFWQFVYTSPKKLFVF